MIGEMRGRLLIVAGVSALIGSAVGFGLGRIPSAPPEGDYPVNSIGLTYGEIDDLPLPDLVLVTTADGIDGYTFALQLIGRPPDGENRRSTPRTIPVYDVDLTEVLGHHRVH